MPAIFKPCHPSPVACWFCYHECGRRLSCRLCPPRMHLPVNRVRRPESLTLSKLQIVQYPHPTLRHKAKPLRRVDAELHGMIREMFDLMYEAKGIGLAATQVDLPYRLFVLNLTADAAVKDEEQVFINPVITARKGMAEAEEGCLSLPGLYADVKRPEVVKVNAYNLAGEEVALEIDELFARAVQHEIDHLDGVLFIDRLPPTAIAATRQKVIDFENEFLGRRERGEIPDDDAIARRLAELEKLRT